MHRCIGDRRALVFTVQSTQRFGVLGVTSTSHDEIPFSDPSSNMNPVADEFEEGPVLPILALEDLLWHQTKNITAKVQSQLKDDLSKYGFTLISVQNKQAVSVIRKLRDSLETNFFPNTDTSTTTTFNAGKLATSSTTYVSEKGVPMYKLGYELCEDRVREVFRVAGGSPDSVEYCSGTHSDSADPNDDPIQTRQTNETRDTWLRGLGLMRHVTDTALELLLMLPPPPVLSSDGKQNQKPAFTHANRTLSWWMDSSSSSNNTSDSDCSLMREKPLPDRDGDFSVLYAMHYFDNSTTGMSSSLVDEPGVAVKAHVDPSLLVVEPFLCPVTQGLQVWDRIHNQWLDCDGPESSFIRYGKNQASHAELMLLFLGKGLGNAIINTEVGNNQTEISSVPLPVVLEPTLHRVVTGDRPRRTVIYEQKYAAYYPPPTFD